MEITFQKEQNGRKEGREEERERARSVINVNVIKVK